MPPCRRSIKVLDSPFAACETGRLLRRSLSPAAAHFDDRQPEGGSRMPLLPRHPEARPGARRLPRRNTAACRSGSSGWRRHVPHSLLRRCAPTGVPSHHRDDSSNPLVIAAPERAERSRSFRSWGRQPFPPRRRSSRFTVLGRLLCSHGAAQERFLAFESPLSCWRARANAILHLFSDTDAHLHEVGSALARHSPSDLAQPPGTSPLPLARCSTYRTRRPS